MISLHKKVERAGGVLKLSNIRPEIFDVFKITRLNEKFDIKDEQEEALADFAAAGNLRPGQSRVPVKSLMTEVGAVS